MAACFPESALRCWNREAGAPALRSTEPVGGDQGLCCGRVAGAVRLLPLTQLSSGRVTLQAPVPWVLCRHTELALQRPGWWLCECVRLSVFSLHCIEFSSENESLEYLFENICKAESPGLHTDCVLLAPPLHSLPRPVCTWVSCRKSNVKTCHRLPCCLF